MLKLTCVAVIAATVFYFYQSYQTHVAVERYVYQRYCNNAIAGKITVDSDKLVKCLNG